MKYLIAIVGTALLIASIGTSLSMPDTRSPVPVLYWVTDQNPARIKQVKLFQEWLKTNHYPEFELRLDTSNTDQSKKIIQGVSGVAGDIIDVGSNDLGYFHAIGLFDDVTDDASRMGFGLDRTYSAIEPSLAIAGRQYLFPCNVSCSLYYVNKRTFARYGQSLPPKRWSFEQFESLGKQFVRAANPDPKRPSVFFADAVDREVMRRSLGLSVFNETLTRCALDDARYVRVLRLVDQWTNVDRILPSQADKDSFSSGVGYGGAQTQLFNDGHYAMLFGSRHLMIQFRTFKPPPSLAMCEPPNGGFPNTYIGPRSAGIYAGSKHKDLARYFLKFLASQPYNQDIIEDGDGLPPDVEAVREKSFLQPAKHLNEWPAHQAFAEAATTIAAPAVNSPYVLNSVVGRIDNAMYDGVMSHVYTPEYAAAESQRRINAEIDQTLSDQPGLRPTYAALLERQRQIDDLRARGQKVPIEWISNPFFSVYYRAMGWTDAK